MYEKLDACPLCQERHFKNHVIAKDHLVSQESFAIVSCSSCGFIFTNPRPTSADIGSYYESEDYVSHKNKSNSIINVAYKIARYFTIRNKVKLVKKYNAETLLDYGCGTGYFLTACKKEGIQTYGVEPDEGARQMALETGINAVSSLSELPEGKKFSVITLWHVLEHVHQLRDTLQVLRPRHLYHFTTSTMLKLMGSLQFKKVDILPQKLDAYYVSLLSEKYLNHSQRILHAIKKGFISNKKASSSKMYSSLIYIFTK
jgi:2-polyprenyl-3-methyl-5-hydroxy-6-metoxy-1,4-benzoquinol methylase